ncbi:hypothetical protein [uncultured Chryseobacterium sp.]|uniref:hypothetical protein n=1 Tax=uncultured Chryseobacterium sp. TaxID=259322 RepID=UPI0025FCE4A5|nr:hypothetical protein [uncultured Chryseobacterium sp.]
MKKLYIPVLMMLSFISCKTRLNQYIQDDRKVNRRNGKWVEEYSADEGSLVASGRYRNGEKVGIWKTSFDGRKFQKDVIKKEVTKTKKYFPNGSIMEKGQSRLEISDRERHWFYFGPWKYYGENGKLLYIKNYRLGQKTDSISMVKQ